MLFDAQLQGASLRLVYVWRTYPPANANAARVVLPQPGPKYSGGDWAETSYTALKSLIKNSVPEELQPVALMGIARLKEPFVADEGAAKAWMDIAQVSARSASSYFGTLAKMLEEIGCVADGAPYVIRGLLGPIYPNRVLLDIRFEGNPSQEAEVAAAFLDEAKCPGARGLSEENKAKLQEIRDRGFATTPGAVAR
jgi:hypothetical protein